MATREKRREQDFGAPQDPESAAGENLTGLREKGRALQEKGLDAIDRVLSTDSEDFLEHSRQRGGQ